MTPLTLSTPEESAFRTSHASVPAGLNAADVAAHGPSLPTPSFPPTEADIQREVEGMLQTELSSDFMDWVNAYAKVGRRNPYLWKWCHRAVSITTLPCVDARLREQLCDTKTLGVMFDVMLDDVADQGGDSRLLEELLALVEGTRIPDFSAFDEPTRRYASFTQSLWNEIQTRAKAYPLYDEFAPLLRFDYLQLSNVMRYSQLLNANPELLNLVEHDLYTPHNMHIMICSTFDLMCAPSFVRDELGKLREITWNAQCMGRIGNLITTWQRELGEGDFTSGVFARAVSRGDLTLEQLRSSVRDDVAAVISGTGHEAYFLKRWRRHRRTLLSLGSDFHSFDVRPLLAGFERLICLHLGSRGNK